MNFSEEWDKLKNLEVGKEITTIRWNDYPVKHGQIVIIRLKQKTIAKGVVNQVGRVRMDKLALDFIQKDTFLDMTKDGFYLLMRQFYHNKPEWKGWESLVKIYFITITEVVKND